MTIYTRMYAYLTQVDESKLNEALGLSDHYCNLTEADLNQTVSSGGVLVPPGLTFKGRKHSEKTKQKMSESISKAMKDNPKARAKNQRGPLNPFYGKKHTEEAKLKMKEKRKGRKTGLGRTWKNKESTKKKLAETCKGRFRVYKEDGTWTWGYPKK